MKSKNNHVFSSMMGMLLGSSLAAFMLNLFSEWVSYHQLPPMEELSSMLAKSVRIWPEMVREVLSPEVSVGNKIVCVGLILLFLGIGIGFGLNGFGAGGAFLASFLTSALSLVAIVIAIVVASLVFCICIVLAFFGIDADPDVIIFFKK